MARKIVLLWSFLCIKRFLNFLKTLFQFDLTNTDGKDRRRHACPATKGLWLYYSPICRCIWLQESPSTFACCHFSVIIDDTDLRFGNLHQRVPLKEGELRTKNNLHSLPLLETLVKSRMLGVSYKWIQEQVNVIVLPPNLFIQINLVFKIMFLILKSIYQNSWQV